MLKLLLVPALVLVASSVLAAAPVRATPSQLGATPKRFHGKRILVVGYYTSGGHSTRISQDPRSEKRGEGRDLIFVNFERFSITDEQIKRALNHYVRIVGTFEYRELKTRVIDPGGPGRRGIEEHTLGFGWMGIYDRQLTKISDFSVVR